MTTMKTIRFNDKEKYLADYWSNNKNLVKEIKDFIKVKALEPKVVDIIKTGNKEIEILETDDLTILKAERSNFLEMFKINQKSEKMLNFLEAKLRNVQKKIDYLENKEVKIGNEI